MHKRKLFVGLAALALILAGCSGDEENKGSGSGNPTSQTSGTSIPQTVYYTITWVVEGVETPVQVAEGSLPVYEGTPAKAATAQYEYNFTGWSPAVINAVSNATYTAQFEQVTRSYKVTFLDEDETTILKESNVAYGDMPVAPSDPSKTDTAEWDYDGFNGWDHALEVVHGEQTYVATYSKSKQQYTVTFYDEDGETVLKTGKVQYGQMPSGPTSVPVHDDTAEWDYESFKGWNHDLEEVKGEQTYIAEFNKTKKSYTITFVDEDGVTELQSGLVNYGETPTAPADPSKDADGDYIYDFSGWDPVVASVTGNQTYTATYSSTKEKYTAKFFNWDGTLLDTVENVDFDAKGADVYSASTPTCAKNEKNTYTFESWEESPRDVGNHIRSFKAIFSVETKEEYLKFTDYETQSYLKGFADGKYVDELYVPRQHNDKPVVGISQDAFSGTEVRDYLTSLYFPTTVQYIDRWAFDGCKNVEHIEFELGDGEDLYLYQSCFRGCSHDGEIILPSRTCGIDSYALDDTHVTGFVFENNYNKSEYRAIDGVLYCSSGKCLMNYPLDCEDTSFTVPAEVTSLYQHVGIYNNYLESIHFASTGNLALDAYTLGGNKITEITFEENVNLSVYWYTFRDCSALENIVLPEHTIVKSAGLNMLTDCNFFFRGTSIDEWHGNWDDSIDSHTRVYIYSADEAIGEYDLPPHITGSWHYVNDVPTPWPSALG